MRPGARVRHRPLGKLAGTILKVIPQAGPPVALVEWDNGHRGKHSPLSLELLPAEGELS